MSGNGGRPVARLGRADLLAALDVERYSPVMPPDPVIHSRHTGLSTDRTAVKRHEPTVRNGPATVQTAAATRAVVAEEIAVHLAGLAYDEAARPRRDAESRLIQQCLRQAADIARQHGREDTDGPPVPGRPGN